ncbi:hypothetical protein F4803DRAFT_265650 [Xylaria telfairii]|nr:hypothetical protein F4803DRAFT_265650 [Xylaria telfairii]
MECYARRNQIYHKERGDPMAGGSGAALQFVNSVDNDLADLSCTLPRCWSADMSKWERLVEHFKASKVLQDERGEWKACKSAFRSIYRSRATGADPTLKLTDFEVF